MGGRQDMNDTQEEQIRVNILRVWDRVQLLREELEKTRVDYYYYKLK